MRALWQLWPNHLPNETVNQIINECEKYPSQNATIGLDNSKADSNYRTSEIKWIDKFNPESRWISDIIFDFAQTANRNAFGFDINYINDIQYTIYRGNNNGKYDWHVDTFWDDPKPFDRKISIIIQLSDGSEYDGGDFQLDPQYPQPTREQIRTCGAVFAFPSFLSHRVTPVTSGIRKSLVCWVEGPNFR